MWSCLIFICDSDTEAGLQAGAGLQTGAILQTYNIHLGPTTVVLMVGVVRYMAGLAATVLMGVVRYGKLMLFVHRFR